jgi:hypothetical protein
MREERRGEERRGEERKGERRYSVMDASFSSRSSEETRPSPLAIVPYLLGPWKIADYKG